MEYEVIRVESKPELIKEKLNGLGLKGYRLLHTQVDERGYTFILGKDTGRQPEDETAGAAGWVDDGFVNEETSWT